MFFSLRVAFYYLFSSIQIGHEFLSVFSEASFYLRACRSGLTVAFFSMKADNSRVFWRFAYYYTMHNITIPVAPTLFKALAKATPANNIIIVTVFQFCFQNYPEIHHYEFLFLFQLQKFENFFNPGVHSP